MERELSRGLRKDRKYPRGGLTSAEQRETSTSRDFGGFFMCVQVGLVSGCLCEFRCMGILCIYLQ